MDPLSTYDPDREPNPQAWLEIDETERLKWVKRFHVQAKIRMPNVTAHAALHLIVENQIALGVECTVGAIARLMGQGLSRHDAIHAVSSVYCEHFYEQAHGRAKDSSEALWASCSAAIERLSAEDWLAKR
jgi:hypothetical protein